METLSECLTATPEGMRLYQQERTILEVTEQIWQILNDKQITKAELARRLGRTKGYITQLLDGRANMTLRTISDVFWALDSSLHVKAVPLTLGFGSQVAGDWSSTSEESKGELRLVPASPTTGYVLDMEQSSEPPVGSLDMQNVAAA